MNTPEDKPVPMCAEPAMRTMPTWKHRTTNQARDALRRFIDRKAVMTIPVDFERDADCILYDVLAERDALLAAVRRLVGHHGESATCETCKAATALLAKGGA